MFVCATYLINFAAAYSRSKQYYYYELTLWAAVAFLFGMVVLWFGMGWLACVTALYARNLIMHRHEQ